LTKQLELTRPQGAPPQHDELDKKIIHFLREDGRMSIIAMAKRLGVGQPTVRRRLNKLLSEGGVSVRALLDPGLAPTGGAASFVLLKVELSELVNVTTALARMPEAAAISIVDGPFNVFLACIYESRDDWLRFYNQKLGPLPGIRDWVGYATIRVVKLSQSYGWVPAYPAA
jgi:Lrp/AsnC family transcriptional regulator for asnA, asnC and gidA